MKGWSKAGLGMLLMAACLCARAVEPDVLSGRYGHDASEPAYTQVWEVVRTGEGWQARNLHEPTSSTATRLSPVARRAFWKKMDWPVDSADAADCVGWGETPPSLSDLLEDRPATPHSDTYGNALLCHVPASARKDIGWLQDSAEDWFYYDPMAGVMDVRQLQ